jgi:hypothetical protein
MYWPVVAETFRNIGLDSRRGVVKLTFIFLVHFMTLSVAILYSAELYEDIGRRKMNYNE